MTIKVIGAGFGRTGTYSTSKALSHLGFPSYHMFEVLDRRKNPGHLDFWHRVANAPAGIQHDWDTVFHDYAATVDNPGCCVWRELVNAYPDAKILLTVHPGGVEAWYESTIRTVYFTESWQFRLLIAAIPVARKFADMAHKLVWHRSHQDTMSDRAAAIAHYQRHIEDVTATVPPEKLLVFSVDQGWTPLCNFLDVPVPETTFPNLNSRTAIRLRAFRCWIENIQLIAARPMI
ncbi:MAG: hypothetical protein HKN28_19835 [Alphaproteobacteria bacterium]|nr:hypothetical protein [Alphaproteobacteria bacterium]